MGILQYPQEIHQNLEEPIGHHVSISPCYRARSQIFFGGNSDTIGGKDETN